MTNYDNGYLFGRNWFIHYQFQLLELLNHNNRLVRFFARRFFKIDGVNSSVKDRKLKTIAPNYIEWQEGIYTKAEFRTKNKYSNRIYYGLYPIWWLAHQWDMFIANNFAPQYNLGFDTLTAYPAAGANSPVDGQVYRDVSNPGETFSAIRSNAGNGSSNTDTVTECERVTCSNTTNQFLSIRRSIFCFDTSALTSAAVISAAVFSLYGESKANQVGGSPALDVVGATPASTSTLANSDYANLGSTVFGSVSYASYASGSYNDFTLDSNGRANISLTGISKFGARVNWDTAGTFGGTWTSLSSVRFNHYYADQTGTSSDPKLVVTYTNVFAPTVTTSTPAGSIDSNSATGGGNVTSDGGATVTERGVVWGTSTNPTTAGNKATTSGTTGAFGPVNLTGLNPDTHYYYRAYAINSVGTSYGANVEFDTLDAVISGTCSLAGSPVSGAIVTLIDSATDTVVGTDTSDGSGNYSFNGLDITKIYHVTAEYEDSPDQYNAKSLPFMTPEEV